MKKLTLALIFIIAAVFVANAADMSTVWDQVKADKTFIVGPVPKAKAQKNGCEQLEIALNTAPTSDQINKAKRLFATINQNQKVTSVSQKGVDVSIYMAPYNTTGTELKIMCFLTKNDNADKSLIVLYGICTKDGLNKFMQNLSIEDLIG